MLVLEPPPNMGVLENLVYFGKTHVFAFSNVKMDVLEYLNILGEFVFVSTHEICLNILENLDSQSWQTKEMKSLAPKSADSFQNSQSTQKVISGK